MDASEKTQRINRRIAAATVKHMSDSKWRKLFEAIHSVTIPLCGVGIKFINDPRLFTESVPGPEFEHANNTGECGGISYQPLAHIEFVEIPSSHQASIDDENSVVSVENDLEGFVERLGQKGDFPVQTIENGIRIIGYEW